MGNLRILDYVEVLSLEELQEMEYELTYNPFDVTGCNYLEQDFIDFLQKNIDESYKTIILLPQGKC